MVSDSYGRVNPCVRIIVPSSSGTFCLATADFQDSHGENFRTNTTRERTTSGSGPEPTTSSLAKAVNLLRPVLNTEAAARRQLVITTYGLARDNDRGELGRQDYAAIAEELYRVSENAKNVEAGQRATGYAAWYEQRI